MQQLLIMLMLLILIMELQLKPSDQTMKGIANCHINVYLIFIVFY